MESSDPVYSTIGNGLSGGEHSRVFCIEQWSFKFQWNCSRASGLTGDAQEAAVRLPAACPHSEKLLRLLKAQAPFSPTAAPELCLVLLTKWRLCVTNWFQLVVTMVSTLEGAVGRKGGARSGGCVTWPHREMPDVMWCVFGRAINSQWYDNGWSGTEAPLPPHYRQVSPLTPAFTLSLYVLPFCKRDFIDCLFAGLYLWILRRFQPCQAIIHDLNWSFTII